jgi:hypothetical protein
MGERRGGDVLIDVMAAMSQACACGKVLDGVLGGGSW